MARRKDFHIILYTVFIYNSINFFHIGHSLYEIKNFQVKLIRFARYHCCLKSRIYKISLESFEGKNLRVNKK